MSHIFFIFFFTKGGIKILQNYHLFTLQAKPFKMRLGLTLKVTCERTTCSMGLNCHLLHTFVGLTIILFHRRAKAASHFFHRSWLWP